MTFLSSHKTEVFFLGFGLGILLFFSCYRLSESPPIWYDEGFFTQMGINLATEGTQNMQIAPKTYVSAAYVTVGYPLVVPLAISYKLFGTGVVQGRGVMVVFIFGLGTISYFFMRKLFGVPQALLTLLLLGTFPMLYGDGKTVIGEVPGLFFLVSCLWALLNLERSNFKEWHWYVAVGLLAGLCAATKPIFLPFLGALFFTYLIRYKKITLTLWGTVFGSVALIVALGLWIILQFGAHASISAILADYVNPYAIDNVGALIAQNARRFVTESTPAFTALLLLVWAIALFIRRNKGIASAEIAAFIFCLLIIASYLRLAGWYRYFFTASIVALLFLPNSSLVIFDAIKKKITFLARANWLPYAAVLLLMCAFLYQTARTSFVAEYYNGTQTRDLAAMIATLDPHTTYFLYNEPQIAMLMPSSNYYQYLSPLPRVILGESELITLRSSVVDIVVVSNNDYTNNPELFAKYQPLKQVGGYLFLDKKI